MSAFFPRRSGRASRVRLLDLPPGVPIRVVCAEGARIVATDGALMLEYLEFGGAWLGGPLPLRRVPLAEGDGHPLPWAGEVTLRAGAGSRCLIEQPLPWWARLFGRGQADAAAPLAGMGPVKNEAAVADGRAGRAVYLARMPSPVARLPFCRRVLGRRTAHETAGPADPAALAVRNACA